MKKRNDNFERIKRFLDNEMALEEAKAFEEALRNDKRLRKELAEQKLISEGLYTIERNRLKSKALEWLNESKSSHSSDSSSVTQSSSSLRRLSTNRVLGIAASFILLACVSYFLLVGGSQRPQALVEAHLAMYHQDPVVLRGGEVNPSWSDAIKSYRSRAFDEMINIMKDDVYSNKANIEQLFYFGLAHLYQEPAQLDSALLYLSKTNVDYNQSFHDEALWYRALILLKKGENTSAIPYLQELDDSKGLYSDKASELLKSMNKQ